MERAKKINQGSKDKLGSNQFQRFLNIPPTKILRKKKTSLKKKFSVKLNYLLRLFTLLIKLSDKDLRWDLLGWTIQSSLIQKLNMNLNKKISTFKTQSMELKRKTAKTQLPLKIKKTLTMKNLCKDSLKLLIITKVNSKQIRVK